MMSASVGGLDTLDETAVACRTGAFERAPPPQQANLGGLEAVWRHPGPGAVRGILILLHGMGHGALDFFERSTEVPGGNGLPEELSLVRAAVTHGWLALAVSSSDRKCKAWNPPDDGPAIARAVAALRVREALGNAPVAALGASNGGQMALLLQRWLPDTCAVVAQISALPAALVGVAMPPTLFVHMALRDVTTGARVREAIAKLRRQGARAAELVVGPKCVTDNFFSERIAHVTPAVSTAMACALKVHGWLDDEGFLLEDPRTSGGAWRECIVKHAAALGDTLVADASPIVEELNVAWAMHEITGEWVEEALEWCDVAGATEVYWRALEEGSEVLAPWHDHSLHRARVLGSLLPEEAALLGLPPKRTQRSLLVAYANAERNGDAGGSSCSGSCSSGSGTAEGGGGIGGGGIGGTSRLGLVRMLSLVPWDNYLTSVIASEPEKPLADNVESLVGDSGCFEVKLWRSELHMEGLFSQLFWALGFLEYASSARLPSLGGASNADGCSSTCFLIDWTDRRVAMSRSSRCCNLWNELFEQPWRPWEVCDNLDRKLAAQFTQCAGLRAAHLQECWASRRDDMAPVHSAAHAAAADGRLHATLAFGPPHFEKFGRFALAREWDNVGGGRLDNALLEHGRHVFRRWLRIRRGILERVAGFIATSMGAGTWLAVHLRLTDKCESNNRPLAALVEEVKRWVKVLCCSGIFLCTDDADMKKSLASALSRSDLAVVMCPAQLSRRGLPAHKDGAVDRVQNARDMLIECLIMAQCKALLGSWSNVTTATVWFAPRGFSHMLFGDSVPGDGFEVVD
eukprot:NODE_247_length_3296_cov_8.165983.p1 GENE.NODE_247_length_3296_cov_8.165983~~NODE_247_length_3296_cov_8.165983.p1  ORF type:complete len:803 (-),score=129.90 NODE_247_length_3296_cov_8.165983:773-3181(-)